mgnify:FL=1
MARPKVLVFQHVPYEPLGTLDPLLKEAGFRIRYVNFGRMPEQRPALDRYAALIVLGGPMNADQIDTYPNLLTEVEIIREAVDRKMSILGICLGAQLLAKALGGRVARNPTREIGWHDVDLTEAGLHDPVLSTFAPRQEVFQWHEDGISLPSGVECLASSPASPVQAFRHGEHAYGFQFHLEANRPLIERWLTVPAHQASLREEGGAADPADILRRAETSMAPLEALSRATFSRWIERLEPGPRRQHLPSR